MVKQGEKIGYVGRILYRGGSSEEFTQLEDLTGIDIEMSLQRCNIEVARLEVSKLDSIFYSSFERTHELEGEYNLEVALVVRDSVVVAMQGVPLVVEQSRLGSSLARSVTIEEQELSEDIVTQSDQDAIVAGLGEYQIELMLTRKDANLDGWDSELAESYLLRLGAIFKGNDGSTFRIKLNGEYIEQQDDTVDLGDLALGSDALLACHSAARLMHTMAIMQEVDGVLYFLGKDFKIYKLSQDGLCDLGVTAKSNASIGSPTFMILDDRLYIFTANNTISIYDITDNGVVFVTSVTLTAGYSAYFLSVDCSDGVYINSCSSFKMYKLDAATNELEEMTTRLTGYNFRVGSPQIGNFTYSGEFCYNKATDTFMSYVEDDLYISGLLNLSYLNYVVVTSHGEKVRLYDDYSALNSDGTLNMDGSYSTLDICLYDTSYTRVARRPKSLLLFSEGTSIMFFEYNVANGVSFAPSEYDVYLDFAKYRVTKHNNLFSVEVK